MSGPRRHPVRGRLEKRESDGAGAQYIGGRGAPERVHVLSVLSEDGGTGRQRAGTSEQKG